MAQIFVNNVDTSLSAGITDAATTATLLDVAGLPTPTGGDFVLLTLIDDSNVEIVKMTARTGNTVTITRAQESTTARAWAGDTRCFAGITAGSLAGLEADLSGTALNTVAIGGDAKADTQWSVAVGDFAWADTGSDASVCVGAGAYSSGIDSVVIGDEPYSTGERGIAIGRLAIAAGARAIAIGSANMDAADGILIGDTAYSDAVDTVTVGHSATNYGQGAVVIGDSATAAAAGAVAIGNNASAQSIRTMHLAALPMVPRHTGVAPFNFDSTTCYYASQAAESVIVSEPISMTATGTHTLTLPANTRFFPDEVGLIVATSNTITVQPTVRFGETADEAIYVAATLTTALGAVGTRERFTSLATGKGTAAPRFEITIAGAATALTARVYWRGFLVRDQ